MKSRKGYLLLATLVVLLVSIMGPGIAAAQESERGLELTTVHPSIVVSMGDKIEIPLKLTSLCDSGERVSFAVASAPEGWECWFEKSYDKYRVREGYVTAAEPLSFYFKAEPSLDAQPDVDYHFTLKAVAEDRAVESSLGITVCLSGRVVSTGEMKLSTDYPVLRGACGAKFKFKVDLANESEKDRSFNLSAVAPEGWDVSFKPLYEETQVSTVSVKAGDHQGLDIIVASLPWEEPGEYTIAVQASAGTIKDALDLKVVLTGSYELAVSTATGRLNTEATAGEESYLSIFVTNTGSADLHDITFSSKKAEGWVVTFSPDRVDSLPPRMMQEVTVGIQPASKAIVGDYSVTLNASTEQLQESVDIRVTVGAPTTWGWVGVAIIVVVVVGLAVLFTRLGRR
jgi:uncharacterized membrane protein